MKKIFSIFFILFISVITTGCVKVSYNIEINNNDKVCVSEIQAINVEPFKGFGGDVEKEIKQQFKEIATDYRKKGYKVEDYKEDSYTGLVVKKTDIAFSEVAKNFPKGFENNSNSFEIKKGLFQNTYKIHIIANREKIENSVTGDKNNAYNSDSKQSSANGKSEPVYFHRDIDPMTGENVEIKRFADGTETEIRTNERTGDVIEKTTYPNGGFASSRYNKKEMQGFNNAMGSFANGIGAKPVMDLTIKIPTKASSHNADKVVNDKEYYWNLLKENSDVEINLEYKKWNPFVICFVIILALLVAYMFMCQKQTYRHY